MKTLNRRYDIDWIRVVAIGLLLVYHVAICFQRWGIMIGFITNGESWESLWFPMTMLNTWRIPLLFFVSGMGVYFAMGKRTPWQLLLERGRRIFIPFLVGAVTIVPLHLYLWRMHYNMDAKYVPGPGHLWFLGNILVYTLVLLPLLYFLKQNETGRMVTALKKILSTPLGLLPFSALFVAEVLIVKPIPFELYAMTFHGWAIGFIAFLTGFCFVLAGETCRDMLIKWRWLFLAVAAALFAFRIGQFPASTGYLVAIESNAWVFTVLAFGAKYLNRPGRALSYLSAAAYPVYILHMVFISAGAMLLFPLGMDVRLKFVLLLMFTLAGCMVTYEFVIRRFAVTRFLLGLRPDRTNIAAEVAPNQVSVQKQ